jgi:CDP-diacylglycerol--glycerol-3-phosphate 3-phosphatidyltransferase
MKNLPNIISVLRIFLCSFLPLLANRAWMFSLLVAIIGLSDVLDGFLARKWNCTTQVGAVLDSVADLVFFLVILIVLWVFYHPLILSWWIFLLVVAFIRSVSAIVAKIRFRKVLFIHTYANKFAGFVIYLAILSLPFYPQINFYGFVLGTALIAAVEELLIIIIRRDINENTRGIFLK